MHNLFLGLFKNDMLSILGMDITLRTKEEPEPPTDNEMKKNHSIVEDPNLRIKDVCKCLLRIYKPVTQELCCQLGGVPLRDCQEWIWEEYLKE